MKRRPQLVRERGQELVLGAAGRLGVAKEPGVVDGDGRAPRHRFGQPEIVAGVGPARAAVDERDGAQRAPAGDQRHAHVGGETQLAEQATVFPILSVDRRLDDLGTEFRPAGAQHARQPVRGSRLGRVAPLKLASRTVPGRIAMDHGQPRQRAVVLHHVDGAPVGQIGHGQARQAHERGLVVERRAQDFTGVDEEGQTLPRGVHGGQGAPPALSQQHDGHRDADHGRGGEQGDAGRDERRPLGQHEQQRRGDGQPRDAELVCKVIHPALQLDDSRTRETLGHCG